MKPQKAVVQETRHIAVGETILCAVMLLVFLAVGKLTWQVALGALIGWLLATGNFFFMAMGIQRLMDSVDPNEEDAAKRAKLKMRFSYNRRMLVMVLLLAASILWLKVNWIAAVVPLIFPSLIIKAMQFWQNRKSKGSEL